MDDGDDLGCGQGLVGVESIERRVLKSLFAVDLRIW